MVSDYSFGELFKGFRNREGYTQQRLADEIGVPRSTITNWEHDIHLPKDLYPVLRIAKVLVLSPEDTNCLLAAADPDKHQFRNDMGFEIKTDSGWIKILPEDISSALRVSEDLPDTFISEGLKKKQIKELAKRFSLLMSREINPGLRYNDGDISFWYEQGFSLDELIMQFGARKVVLDAAERSGVNIDKQGRLSVAATEVIPLLRRSKGK